MISNPQRVVLEESTNLKIDETENTGLEKTAQRNPNEARGRRVGGEEGGWKRSQSPEPSSYNHHRTSAAILDQSGRAPIRGG